MDRRAKDKEKEGHDKYLSLKQIQNDQREYQRRLEMQKNGCGVSDLI